MIRAILVDDRKSHLNLLIKALTLYSSDLEIVGAYTNPMEATALIIHLKPDALFLDIEMPGKSGFEIATSVNAICSNVIYLTNYMKYGSEAFRYKAIYLIDKDRMEEFLPEAIARLKAILHQEHPIKANNYHSNVLLEEPPKYHLKKICILGIRKISFTLANNKKEFKKDLKLSVESYRTLSKFIAFKILGSLLDDPKSFVINQMRDQEVFINLSQSKAHFIKDINVQLEEDNIHFLQEDFFRNEEGGGYTFTLNANAINLYQGSEYLDAWVLHFIKPVIKHKKLMIDCLVDNGTIKIIKKLG